MLNIIFHQICIKYFSKKVISFKLHPLNTVICFIILERPLLLGYYLSDRHQLVACYDNQRTENKVKVTHYS